MQCLFLVCHRHRTYHPTVFNTVFFHCSDGRQQIYNNKISRSPAVVTPLSLYYLSIRRACFLLFQNSSNPDINLLNHPISHCQSRPNKRQYSSKCLRIIKYIIVCILYNMYKHGQVPIIMISFEIREGGIVLGTVY